MTVVCSSLFVNVNKMLTEKIAIVLSST